MKRRVSEIGASALAFTTVFALTTAAQAQEPAAAPPAAAPAPATAEAGGSASVGGGGQAGGAMTLPAAAPAAAGAPAQAVAGDSEHDQVIGTLGIGYLGRRSINVGVSPTTVQAVDAPIIGVRYWVDQMIGIDAGIGLGIRSFGGSTNGADQPGPGTTAFLIHGGVPLALANSGHFSFQVIPELNVGFGGFSQDIPNTGGTSGSGFHLDIGARAGAEIHFGFIGLPKLSLQGTVGLAFTTESTKFEDKTNPNAVNTVKRNGIEFATSVQDNPWNIFTSNVAALYYF